MPVKIVATSDLESVKFVMPGGIGQVRVDGLKPAPKCSGSGVARVLPQWLSGRDAVLQYERAGGRPRVLVAVDGRYEEFTQALVRQGLAQADGDATHLHAAEQHAQRDARGLWGACSPSFRDFALSALSRGFSPTVLYSIAQVESGGRPWTINLAGEPHRFASKQQAVAFAKSLVSAGRSDFDVGLMQVNWRWHRERFASIEEAFDPITNIRVAAEILQANLLRAGSDVRRAVGLYHSGSPERARNYLQKFDRQHDRSLKVAQFEARAARKGGDSAPRHVAR